MENIKSHEIVQKAKAARPQLNYDIASETEARISQDIYFGTIIANKSKTIGGNIVMRLIEIAEDEIIGKR